MRLPRPELRSAAARRVQPGVLRTAKSFPLPVGTRISPGAVRGYYIDLRGKAESPSWPSWILDPAGALPSAVSGITAERVSWVAIIQWGLGCAERYEAGEGDAWLAGAVETGEFLMARQVAGGPRDGGWLHAFAYPHTYRLPPPWLSAMAQGQGASLLVRLHRWTGRDDFAAAAVRALAPFDVPVDGGGVRAELGGRPWPEEYPTRPHSFVLNGGIFALWGGYDVGAGLDDDRARERFEAGVDGLTAGIERWDTGFWSRYDLFPHPVPNVATPFYHALHINQLRALQVIAPRPELAAALTRFEAYARSRGSLRRAYAYKVAFRVLVPRSARLARALPWSAPVTG